MFDAARPGSRPNQMQQQIFDDLGKIQYRYVVAGNQCLERGTLIATPRGPRAIEEIKPGDEVYDEHGKPISVLQTFQNGAKQVADLTLRGMKWGACTSRHVFQVTDSHAVVRERAVGSFVKGDLVRRVQVRAPLGNISVPRAYALGALLGDGCSRQGGPRIQISSGTAEIPQHVASLLGNTALRLHPSNYTWSVGVGHIPYYEEWCRGRYAHEKIVDLSVVKEWDRESLLQFVAGVVDTDGSLHPAKDHVSFSLGMQAKSVVDAIEYAFLALWQLPLSRAVDSRPKYKNGPLHQAYTRSATLLRHAWAELNPYLHSSARKWRPEYNALGGRRMRLDGVGLQYAAESRIAETFDIHVDSKTNLYLLANGLITHNSGKSSTPAREMTWMLSGTHPTWVRPSATQCPVCRTRKVHVVDRQKQDYACDSAHEWRDWGDGPLLFIVAGQDRKMMELELWEKKIRRFLVADDWHETRSGQQLTHVKHRRTGDTIIFISHADSSETNRKHMQGYVACYVWLDEMPASIRILEELQRRVDSMRGYFISTFTPKFRNAQIKKIVDSQVAPTGRKYKMSKFDNPLFRGAEEEERRKLIGHSEEYIAAVTRGDWMSGEGAIYEFVPERHGGIPTDYHPGWRHVLVVDPATESKLGFELWAEDPRVVPDTQTRELPAGKRVWWCVRAEYIEGIFVPTKIIEEVERRALGVNLIERRADTAATWFIRQASSMPVDPELPVTSGKKYEYKTIPHKNDVGAKDEFIRLFQQALGVEIRVADWCHDYIEELQTYERSEATGKIVQASRFHLIDSGHYFVQQIPPAVHQYVYQTWDDRVYQAHLLEERRQELARQAHRAGQRHMLQPLRPGIEEPLPRLRNPNDPKRKSWRRVYRTS